MAPKIMMNNTEHCHCGVKDGKVLFFDNCHLSVESGPWEFAVHNRVDIAAHWKQRVLENPRLFNGIVHVLVASDAANSTFIGKYARTDFASYLFWRETGFADPTACDCFATVLLIGRQGRVLVAKAAPYTLNAGLYTAPGGFIDERDVDTSGHVDLRACALREVFEETGLRPDEIQLDDGLWVARDGALMAMALIGRASCSDDEIVARLATHNAGVDDAELGEARWLARGERDPAFQTPRYMRLLLSHLDMRQGGA